MADSENDQLRTEVARQKRIIDALLDSNRELKQALAGCRHLLLYSEQRFYSNDSGAGMSLQQKDAAGESNYGVKQPLDTYPAFIDGVIQRFDDVERGEDGVNNPSGAIAPGDNGVKPLLDTGGVVMDGVNNMFGADTAPGEGTFPGNTGSFKPGAEPITHQTALPPPPVAVHSYNQRMYYNDKEVALSVITANDIAEGKKPVNYFTLFNLLRKMITRASDGGLINTAQILMKLYESPAQSLKSLQKLTHLSEDGITKRIMAMKKFGLIVRASGRRLLLTEKAQQLLDKAKRGNAK